MATKSLSTQSGSKSTVHHIPILEARDFPGLYTYPKPQQIPRGAAQQSLNFLTRSSWVEQRGGYHPLGAEAAGAGRVLGIFTAHKWDGTEVIFKATLDGKLSYFDGAAWQEVGGAGANILAKAAAAGENVYMDEYVSAAGAQLWVSSPSSDFIKIMTANPASWLSQFNASVNFTGRLRIIQNSMFMWHYRNGTSSKPTGATLQRSYIDAQNYTTQTDNAITLTTVGDAVSGTLSKNSVANATVFGLAFAYTDGAYTETFSDDYLGNLSGSHGGTGNIDYSTGKFTITPGTGSPNPPASPVLNCVYSYEDSTNQGIADFLPDIEDNVRTPGSGVSWNQNNGGDILGVDPYNGSFYVLHQRKSYVVTPTPDDSGASNLIYRDNMYLASERGSLATADGIYYIDTTNAAKPFIALLSYSAIAAQVLPQDLSSDILDLSAYLFDQCVAEQGLDFILFWCRTPDSAFNNRCIVYNFKLSTSKRRIFDVLDYFANCACIYGGQVVAGDSVSNNVFKLFDGFDDDGGIINSAWAGNQDDHGIAGLKQTKKLWIEGYIGINQSVGVYVALDANAAAQVGTILGNGVYVDTGLAVTIGSLQIGVFPIPGPTQEPIGFHYLIQITVNTSKYKYFTIQFVPTAVGYFSFQMYANYDIRINVDKLPRKYRDIQPRAGSGGSSGGGTPLYVNVHTETPQGAIDGVNLSYTVKLPITSVYSFEINGEAINSGMYTILGTVITFKEPLDSSLGGAPFEIVYG